eukprot:scaffold91317_cov21-Tisochrysis_lutea.AAC.1
MYGAYGIRARSGMYELARLEGSGMAVPKHLQSLPAGKNNLRPAARPLSWQGGLARSVCSKNRHTHSFENARGHGASKGARKTLQLLRWR